jgi:ATP-dependent RNA helicase HelY
VETDPELRARLRAAESADRIDRELATLERRMDASRESVGRRFDDVVGLLERRGCVEGWTLTDKGRTLARVFHEMDLLVVESIVGGHLEGLDPAELAALCSTLVYEARGADDRPAPRMPTATLAARWRDLSRTARALRGEYDALGVGTLREPDPGFVVLAHEWASGDALADVLEGAELSAGDFVRTTKQLADLLHQVALVAPSPLAATAEAAVRAIDRGIVAYVGAAG